MEGRLKRRSVFSLDGHVTGTSIACVVGFVWVTQEGDANDYVLGPGEAFVAKRDGLIVVEALNDSSIRVEALERKVA